MTSLSTAPDTSSSPELQRAPLESDLGWALGMAFRAYVKSADAAVADLPGGLRSYQVLAEAAQNLPCSQQALGHRIGIDRSVMTYLVDDLVAAGLVDRQPDPADRRARRVVLTPAGRAQLAELDERLRRVEEHVLAVLDPEARDGFRAAIGQIAGHADALDPANSMCDAVADLVRLDDKP